MGGRRMLGKGGGGADPVCTGITYGSYSGTKSVYCDGASNFLRNPDFSYDNSVTGFTILSMWYEDTATWQDFLYKLNIKTATSVEVGTVLGTANIGGRAPSSPSPALVTSVSDVTNPNYVATTYTPDGLGGSDAALYVNGVEVYNANFPASEWGNWNAAPLELYIFRRNGGGARSIGYCGFLQIVDAGISPLCAQTWTSNAQPRNIVGSFNDVILADFESGVQNNGSNDVIADLSSNSYDLILDGFSAAQKDPLNAAYCIKDIP